MAKKRRVKKDGPAGPPSGPPSGPPGRGSSGPPRGPPGNSKPGQRGPPGRSEPSQSGPPAGPSKGPPGRSEPSQSGPPGGPSKGPPIAPPSSAKPSSRGPPGFGGPPSSPPSKSPSPVPSDEEDSENSEIIDEERTESGFSDEVASDENFVDDDTPDDSDAESDEELPDDEIDMSDALVMMGAKSGGPPMSTPQNSPLPPSGPPSGTPSTEEDIDNNNIDEIDVDDESESEEDQDEESVNPDEIVPTEVIDDDPSESPIVEAHDADPRDEVEIEVVEIGELSPLRKPLRDPVAPPPEPVERTPQLEVASEMGSSKLVGHIVPHTHWDRAWYLPFQKYRYKLVELVDDLLDLMEANPESFPTFELDGQTVLIEDYLEVRPENITRLRNLVESGRISIGPWYVLPDEYIVGGEGLVRNLIAGNRVANAFGGRSDIGYVPDPFGHIGQLPAILQGCGLDSFIFTRGAGPWVSEEAKGLFYWAAADGETKVLAIKQVPDYPNLMAWGFEERPLDRKDSENINLDTAMAKMERLLDLHKTYNWRPEHLLFGQGSDHTTPQVTLPKLITAANNHFGNKIQFKHSSFKEYVDDLKSWIGRKKIHQFQGELHDGWDRNVLSGVFSARMYLKRINDQTMRSLRDKVEPLSAAARAFGGRNRQERINLAWREVLRTHPHDDICGCSVDAVHEDNEVSFRHAEEISTMLVGDAVDDLRGAFNLHHVDRDSVPLLLHNPLPVPWSGTLPIDLSLPAYRCYLESSTPLKIQLSKPADGCLIMAMASLTEPVFSLHEHPDRAINVELPKVQGAVLIHNLPPGIHVAHLLPGHGSQNIPGKPVKSGGRQGRTDWIDNGLVRVEFRQDGRWDVVDAATKRTYSGVARLEDSEDAGDSYDWSPGGHPCDVGSGRGEKMQKRAQPVDRRICDKDLADQRDVTVTLMMETEWLTTVHVQVHWSLPTNFNDATQTRSTEEDWLTVDHYVTLRSGSKIIEVETWMNNNSEDHRLRLCLPTGLSPNKVWSGAAYDVQSHPTSWPHNEDWEQPHVPTQHFSQFVALQDRVGGLAVLVPGSNEYETAKTDDADGLDIRVTMLRATGWLSRDGFASRRNRAGPCYPAPGAQCKGQSWMKWGILPYDGLWAQAGVHEKAESFSSQASLYSGLPKPQLNGFFDEPTSRGIRGRSTTVVRFVGDGPRPLLSACKPAEDGDGTVIRIFNPTKHSWEGRIETDLPLFECFECDMLENSGKNVDISDRGWDVTIGAKKILTFRFK